MLSPLDQSNDSVEGLECGANIYMSKPFSTMEWLRIEELKRILLKQDVENFN